MRHIHRRAARCPDFDVPRRGHDDDGTSAPRTESIFPVGKMDDDAKAYFLSDVARLYSLSPTENYREQE